MQKQCLVPVREAVTETLKLGQKENNVKASVRRVIKENDSVVAHGDNGDLMPNYTVTQASGRRRMEADREDLIQKHAAEVEENRRVSGVEGCQFCTEHPPRGMRGVSFARG